MRSKVTVVLLFLNVVLFAYIYYFDQPGIEAQKNLNRRVLPTEIASMDSLTRTTRAGEVVKLQKRGENWWLVKPYEWPANPDAVAHIHNELQFLEHQTSFAVADLAKTGQTLADYGLADPALTLEFTSAGSPAPLKLLIGDDTKVGNRLYVLSPDGTRIHVVGRSLADSAGLPLSDLRNPAVFTVPVFEVRSLNIQTAAPANLKVRLRRDGASRWGFESPILARAAKTAVEVTINALNGLTAKSFLTGADADLDRTGLNAPALRVTLEGNARRETLLIGNAAPAKGEYFAKIEDKPVVFTTALPDPLLKVLRSSQETLRDPHVADFDPATVTSLTIVAPGQPEIALQKLESATPATPAPAAAAETAPRENWQVVTRTAGQAPVTVTGDTAVIADVLQKIQALSARPNDTGAWNFLSDAPSAEDIERYGFARPEREITLNLNTGGGLNGKDPSTLVLQVGVSLKPADLGKAFARLTNPPFVYEIVPDILDQTPAAARHYRQRVLRDLPEGAHLTSVSLVDLATNTPLYTQKLREGDKNWDAALAAEPEVIRPALIVLLGQLRKLRAQSFVADTFSPDHADSPQGPHPWRYRLDYTIAYNGDAAQGTPSSLLLTERLGGASQIAGTADFGGVDFNVTQELIDAIFTLTYVTKHDPGPTPTATTPAAAAPAPTPASTTAEVATPAKP